MKNSEYIFKNVINNYPDIKLLKVDGFDKAINGISYRGYSSKDFVLVYSIKKCIEVLMERDNMSYEVAREYLDYNVINAYISELMPIFVEDEMI